MANDVILRAYDSGLVEVVCPGGCSGDTCKMKASGVKMFDTKLVDQSAIDCPYRIQKGMDVIISASIKGRISCSENRTCKHMRECANNNEPNSLSEARDLANIVTYRCVRYEI